MLQTKIKQLRRMEIPIPIVVVLYRCVGVYMCMPVYVYEIIFNTVGRKDFIII